MKWKTGSPARTILPALAAVLLSLVSGMVAAQEPKPEPKPEAKAEQPPQPPGKVVYDQWCVICHGDGPYKAGTAGLQTKYKGEKPALLEQRTDLTPEIVKAFVRNGVRSMPPFRKTEITDAQLEDLAAYLSRDRSQ